MKNSKKIIVSMIMMLTLTFSVTLNQVKANEVSFKSEGSVVVASYYQDVWVYLIRNCIGPVLLTSSYDEACRWWLAHSFLMTDKKQCVNCY